MDVQCKKWMVDVKNVRTIQKMYGQHEKWEDNARDWRMSQKGVG
jgi:hypothetical protein